MKKVDQLIAAEMQAQREYKKNWPKLHCLIWGHNEKTVKNFTDEFGQERAYVHCINCGRDRIGYRGFSY